jgi:spore coat polysaccharide biosynthesis protein SpsF
MHDVLDRYYQAARLAQADGVARFTADCPLLDAGVIDHTVDEFLRTGADFAANRLPPPLGRTYPIGLDTEVCTFSALERAWKEAVEKHQREHVMPYLYETPGRFKVLRVDHDPDYGDRRWTVDTAEDLALVREIFSRFDGRLDFSWLEVLALFEREPKLAMINASIPHKTYMDVDGRNQGSKPGGY